MFDGIWELMLDGVGTTGYNCKLGYENFDE